jgi:O-acetyl-ADP-ribose deacetylase
VPQVRQGAGRTPRWGARWHPGGMRISCHLGDITTVQVDAVVNAANSGLMGGGGVDGAIHRAAGPQLLEECRRLRATRWRDGLPVGEAVATGAGNLPARWVIHTVGPNRHRGQTDPELLASCFRRSLEVADELTARSVAFPAISAGIYGWDAGVVAGVAVDTVRAAAPSVSSVREVRFVLFGAEALDHFERALGA